MGRKEYVILTSLFYLGSQSPRRLASNRKDPCTTLTFSWSPHSFTHRHRFFWNKVCILHAVLVRFWRAIINLDNQRGYRVTRQRGMPLTRFEVFSHKHLQLPSFCWWLRLELKTPIYNSSDIFSEGRHDTRNTTKQRGRCPPSKQNWRVKHRQHHLQPDLHHLFCF
jgi:hypothetical protein